MFPSLSKMIEFEGVPKKETRLSGLNKIDVKMLLQVQK